MQEEINEFSQCVQNHIDAVNYETKAKDWTKKCRYARMQAWDRLKAKERELLQDGEINL